MAELEDNVHAEVIPEVLSTGSVAQDCDGTIDTVAGLENQTDNSLCSKSDLKCPEEVNSSESRDSTYNHTEDEDHKIRNYYYSQDISKTHTEEKMSAPKKECDIERGSNCSNQNEGFSPCDRNIHHLCKHSNYDGYNCNIDQSQTQHHVYLEEHTYKRKDHAIPKSESHLEKSYDYHTNSTDETLNQSEESACVNNDIYVNPNNSHSECQNYVQMTNLPIDAQDSCCNRKYEYLEDSTNVDRIKNVSPKKYEICNAGEYDCHTKNHLNQDGSNVNNYNMAPCHDEYYSYELPNENIYRDEEALSIVEQHSEEQSSIYQPTDCSVYNKEEPLTSEHESCHNYVQNDSYSEEKPYGINNNQYHETLLGNGEILQRNCNVLAQGANDHMCKVENTFKRDETSAVDLRILRPLRYHPYSSQIQGSYSIQEPTRISQASDDLHICHHPDNKASQTETSANQEEHFINSGYIIPDHTSYEEECRNPLEQPRDTVSFKYSICETIDKENNNLWDAATNTEHTKVEEKETQTEIFEMREIGVQTDENTILPLAFLKNIEKEITKHTCHICHRVYISKTGFDRHLRTHEKEKNNIIANVRFTTEAKLQICKRTSKTKNLKTQKPIIIHVPRSIYQCEMCHKTFRNQKEKDNHDCTFKPFPLTKCPECNIKFYTTGALNEHIGIVHQKANAYYCIFCNKSFHAGYNFHLHLDEHLSTQ